MGNAANDSSDTSPKQYQAAQSTWDEIAASKPFQDLLATKKTFIVPAFVFFGLAFGASRPGTPFVLSIGSSLYSPFLLHQICSLNG